MTVLDLILLAVLALFVIRGIFRGFLLELFDLVSLVVGYFAARWLGPGFGWWLADALEIDRGWTGLIATIIVFVAVTIAVRMLAHVLKKITHAVMLGGIDRTLGALFGAFKTVLLAMAIFFIALMSPWSQAATDYALQGRVSRVIVSWTLGVQDMLEKQRTPSTQLFANWLRAGGVNEDAVHIVSDQPELLSEILEYARDHDLNVPVKDIFSGEHALTAPENFKLSEEQQDRLTGILEDAEVSAEEKAEAFWKLLTGKVKETI
ncbi:CvpA family protein [bacterium]|nr:CvpA family protein [bacterium]